MSVITLLLLQKNIISNSSEKKYHISVIAYLSQRTNCFVIRPPTNMQKKKEIFFIYLPRKSCDNNLSASSNTNILQWPILATFLSNKSFILPGVAMMTCTF